MTNTPTFDRLESECLFCDPGRHGQSRQVLLRSDNFYLFAPLGAIVDGYIIITPYRCDDATQRLRSLAELPPAWYDELAYLRLMVADFYAGFYGGDHKSGVSALAFEHGRAGTCGLSQNSTRHCYHTHLCCYPFPVTSPGGDVHGGAGLDRPLWEDIKDHASLEVSDLHDLPAAVGGTPYLYIESVVQTPGPTPEDKPQRQWQHRVVRLGTEQALESQYLRRLLANRMGTPERWNWRTYQNVEATEHVREKFQQFCSDNRDKYAIKAQDCQPRISFLDSVVASNRAGNDVNAAAFARLWGRRLQHEALGQFLKHLKQASTNGDRCARVLDCGCGPANYAEAFYYQGIDCVGIDNSVEMLAMGRAALKKLDPIHESVMPRPAQPELRLADVVAGSLPEGLFDGIWCSAMVVHVPRRQLPVLLAKLYDALKPGGVMYLSAQTDGGVNQRVTLRADGRAFFYYASAELREVFHLAGFEIRSEWEDVATAASDGATSRKVWRQFILRRPVARIEVTHAAPEQGRLCDFGEANLHAHIFERLSRSGLPVPTLPLGDDCAAFLVAPGDALVVTTDPCPLPVLSMLDGDDYRRSGWFSMVIGLSDLAAMGARPTGMLLAIEAPESMPMREFDAFYDGALEASKEFECPIVGGNIKDAVRFNCVGTALGSVSNVDMLRRCTAAPGDTVVVLGEMGRFWAGVLAKLDQLSIDAEALDALMIPLRRPWPRVREGQALVREKLSRCAMDSSDGLTACFRTIAEESRVDLIIDIDQLEPLSTVRRVAELTGIDARKLMVSWGDWELVCTVPAHCLRRLHEVMRSLGCPVAEVGRVTQGKGTVWARERGVRIGRFGDFASTRFTSRSYFSHGLDAYVCQLRNQPLNARE